MWTTCSTRSTPCWRRTPRSLSGAMCRRAASSLPGRVAAYGVPPADPTPEGTYVAAVHDSFGRLPAVFTTPGTSSFTEFLSLAAPELLPGRRPLPPGMAAEMAPHATTIVAISCAGGVVMA